MTLAYDVARGVAQRDVARVIARDRLVERRIAGFREPLQTRVRALARRHPRIGDLAASFPALIAALAIPRHGLDAERALVRVVAGAPLKTLARMADVPLWLRALKPEAIPAPLPALPDNAWFSHRITNHIPRGKEVPAWLDAVARAYAYADDAVALWIAREWAKQPMPKLRPKHGGGERDELRLVSLWAWHSLHGEAPELMEGRFTLEMEMHAACIAAREWRENVAVHLDFSAAPIAEPWLPGGKIGRYELRPVRTAQELIDEAREMKHCVRTFSSSVAQGGAQVWSVYDEGSNHVATLMVGRRFPSPFLDVHDLRGPMNSEVSREMWRDVFDWLRAREAPEASSQHRCKPPCAIAWARLWRRYWLAKRRIPDWLPLAPNVNALWGL